MGNLNDTVTALHSDPVWPQSLWYLNMEDCFPRQFLKFYSQNFKILHVLLMNFKMFYET